MLVDAAPDDDAVMSTFAFATFGLLLLVHDDELDVELDGL